MVDREKIIKGMERFKADFKPFCGNGSDWERFDDVINLLKEQEPKIVIKDIYGNAYCPHCSTEKTVEMMAMKLHVGTNFCPYCGRAVKWDD